MAIFEGIGPAIEVFGYCFLTLGFIMGFVSVQAWLILLIAADRTRGSALGERLAAGRDVISRIP